MSALTGESNDVILNKNQRKKDDQSYVSKLEFQLGDKNKSLVKEPAVRIVYKPDIWENNYLEASDVFFKLNSYFLLSLKLNIMGAA